MHIEQDIPALRQKHYAVMSKELAEIQRRRAELHSSRDTPTSSQAATESPSLRRKALASRSRRWRGFKDRDSSGTPTTDRRQSPMAFRKTTPKNVQQTERLCVPG